MPNPIPLKTKSLIHKDESAMGFVESLVAIAVGGVACVALFSVASAVIREANYNEVRDAMNMYAIEGMDIVRSAASRSYADIPTCDPGSPNTEVDAIIIPGKPNLVKELEAYEDPCTDVGTSTGVCERLTMPKGSDPLFYREVTFTGAGSGAVVDGACVSMRVEVSVGLLINAGETDPPRGNLSEKTIVGYVFK
jgi:hypothetical protein